MQIRGVCWRSSPTLNQLIFLFWSCLQVQLFLLMFVPYYLFHYLSIFICFSRIYFFSQGKKYTRRMRSRRKEFKVLLYLTFSVHLHVCVWYLQLRITPLRTLVILLFSDTLRIFSVKRERRSLLFLFLSLFVSLAFGTRSHLSYIFCEWLDLKKKGSMWCSVAKEKKDCKMYTHIQLNIPHQKVLPPLYHFLKMGPFSVLSFFKSKIQCSLLYICYVT